LGSQRWSRASETFRDAYERGGARGTVSTVAGYLQWKLRNLPMPGPNSADLRKYRRNLRRIRELEPTPWMRLLRASQAEIAESSTDAYLATYQAQEVHYWTEVARWLFEDAPRETWSRVLDVGCGYGTLSVFLTHLFDGEVYSTDMLENRFTAELAERSKVHFARHNIELDPLPWDGPFDAIVFTEVLEHLNFYPVPTLVKLREVLAPGGRLYLSTPDAAEWGRVLEHYRSLDDMPLPEVAIPRLRNGEIDYVDAHIWQYAGDELDRVLGEAGFEVVRRGYAPGVVGRHFNYVLMPA
jgi:SAM-dependent methyltransferase